MRLLVDTDLFIEVLLNQASAGDAQRHGLKIAGGAYDVFLM
jgi:hypothetical protein